MEPQSIVGILLCVVFLLATSGVSPAFGCGKSCTTTSGTCIIDRLATLKCSHIQLYAAGGEAFECQRKHLEQYLRTMMNIYKNGVFDLQEACETHNEIALEQISKCSLNFAESCLPDYFSDFLNKVHDVLILDCNRSTPYFNSTMMDRKWLELRDVIHEFVENFKKDPKGFAGFINLDKQCTFERAIQMTSAKISPCMERQIFGQSFNATERYLRLNEEGELGDMSFCKRLGKGLDECFDENECFSQREMEMARDVIVTIYNIGMELFTMIANPFGSLSDFADFVHNDVTLKWNDHTIPLPTIVDPIVREKLDEIDHAIWDFNSDDCELNQHALEKKGNGLINN